MAANDKFVVAEGRTMYGKDKTKFPSGKKVSVELLGVDKKAFDTLVKEGSVVDPGKKKKAEEPEKDEE